MHGWHGVLFCISGTEQVDATHALQSLSLMYGETVIDRDETQTMNMDSFDLISSPDNINIDDIIIP